MDLHVGYRCGVLWRIQARRVRKAWRRWMRRRLLRDWSPPRARPVIPMQWCENPLITAIAQYQQQNIQSTDAQFAAMLQNAATAQQQQSLAGLQNSLGSGMLGGGGLDRQVAGPLGRGLGGLFGA